MANGPGKEGTETRPYVDFVTPFARPKVYIAMPVLTGSTGNAWFWRWQKDHHVVLRKPNRRFKASKPTLQCRLRAMWRNNVAVRVLAEECLGHDLQDSIYGLDQKGLHMNEAGAKCVATRAGFSGGRSPSPQPLLRPLGFLKMGSPGHPT